jgi:hypothetical protein
MHRELTKAAAVAQRSISEEIEFRLNRDFSDDIDRLRAETRAYLDIAKAQLDADRIAAIRQAGFQIVREAGGKVTVNVSAELLLAEADGILRSGFVAAENVDKSVLEVLVEKAVTAALEKAGLLTGRKSDSEAA